MDQWLARDQAYEAIKRRILSLSLAPGAVLAVDALAGELELGRTPIREALQRLEGEGLVVVLRRKGTFVAPLPTEHYLHLLEYRRQIECMAVRLAEERSGAQAVQALDAILARSGDDVHWDVDRAFHLELARASQNPYLLEAVERAYNLSIRMAIVILGRRQSREELIQELTRIRDAIACRDGALAERLIAQHINDSSFVVPPPASTKA
jgi:DNA-binding GntR family transcriptional regulator